MRGKLTTEQVTEMAELREQGWSYKRLGARFGITPGAVHYRCLTMCAVSPRSRSLGRSTPRSAKVAGFGRVVRPFTPEEDAKMLALAEQGLTSCAIAAVTGRAKSSVRVRMLTLGVREEIAA